MELFKNLGPDILDIIFGAWDSPLDFMAVWGTSKCMQTILATHVRKLDDVSFPRDETELVGVGRVLSRLPRLCQISFLGDLYNMIYEGNCENFRVASRGMVLPNLKILDLSSVALTLSTIDNIAERFAANAIESLKIRVISTSDQIMRAQSFGRLRDLTIWTVAQGVLKLNLYEMPPTLETLELFGECIFAEIDHDMPICANVETLRLDGTRIQSFAPIFRRPNTFPKLKYVGLPWLPFASAFGLETRIELSQLVSELVEWLKKRNDIVIESTFEEAIRPITTDDSEWIFRHARAANFDEIMEYGSAGKRSIVIHGGSVRVKIGAGYGDKLSLEGGVTQVKLLGNISSNSRFEFPDVEKLTEVCFHTKTGTITINAPHLDHFDGDWESYVRINWLFYRHLKYLKLTNVQFNLELTSSAEIVELHVFEYLNSSGPRRLSLNMPLAKRVTIFLNSVIENISDIELSILCSPECAVRVRKQSRGMRNSVVRPLRG